MFKPFYKSESHSNLMLIIVFLPLTLSFSLQAKEVTMPYKRLTLNANLEMAEGKDFNDGMVLILHGYLAHNKMEIINTAQQALLDNARSSLAINLSLGIDNRHGYHGCSLPHRHIQDNAVYELGAWVGWLRNKGATRVTLMGHSRGANQIMVYVVEQKDVEVTHMVMLAPGAGDDINKLYQERYGKSIDETLTYALKQIKAGKGDEFMENIDIPSCPKATISANSFVSYYSENNKFRQFNSYLPKSPIPTLILAGTIDERQPDIVELLSPISDGKHIKVSVIEGAGHFFRDFNIEEAMEAAIEFIDE